MSNNVSQLVKCTAVVHAWLQINALYAQPDKIGSNTTHGYSWTRQSRRPGCNACFECRHSTGAADLGVTIDQKLSFDQHVTNKLASRANITSDRCVMSAGWSC